MKKTLLAWIVLLSGFFLHQCSQKSPQEPLRFNLSQSDGCIACHMNADLLKQVATPLPPTSGESGEG